MKKNKSFCPVNQALEIIGDQWTLLIIRDIMFHGKRHFREFLASEENIASNILADRLKNLEDLQIVVKSKDAHHKQKYVYTLNYRGISLIPVMFELYIWTDPFANLNEKDKALRIKLVRGGENLKHKMKTELIKEIKDLFKNDDDLFRSHQERFGLLVRRMSDIC